MTFGEAIQEMKYGYRVARSGWNGKGMWLAICNPSETDRMTLPFVFMKTVQGELVPWNGNQLDMLSDDWEAIKGLDV